MKKILILLFIFLSAGIINGQQTVDYILKARALTSGGKTDQAIVLLNKALGENQDSRLFTERAEANLLKGDYSGAISDYNEANRISSSSGEYGLARVYAIKGDAATALYHLGLNLNSKYKCRCSRNCWGLPPPRS